MTIKDPHDQTDAEKALLSRMKWIIVGLRSWFNRNPWVKSILTVLLILIPVYFLGRSLWENWQTLTASGIQIDWGRMALSLAILMVAFALFPLGTLVGLRGLGVRGNYSQAYYGYHASQLGKYIPGRIWIIPGRAVTLHRYNVDAVIAGASALIDTYVLVVAGILVYVPAMFTTEQEMMRQLGLLSLILCIPLLVSIIFPSVLNKLFALVMKWVGRGEVTFHFAWYHFALMLLNYLVLWIVSGAGLYLLADSLFPMMFSQLRVVIGAMGFSWVLGTLSFLTPAGLGVREGVMGLLLAGLMPAPIPALVAILARFWWSLADFSSIGLAFLFFGRRGDKGK